MDINLQNIEQLIFFDKKIYPLLPEFRHLFDQWQLSKRAPGLGTLGPRSVLELLNSLEAKHIRILEEYFGDTILLDRVDHRIVQHYEAPLEEADGLCQFAGYKDICLHRDKDRLQVTLWR